MENPRYVADLKQGVYYQKCYDPDCQGFKSLARDIPYYALPALYFEKQSFQHISSDYFNDDNDDLILAAADELELITSG
ncbi:hypothetical protein Btru_069988 [Bulinus truncatus]|nr:hypothetical protein Btru_069988 [Bulinus truncatus]